MRGEEGKDLNLLLAYCQLAIRLGASRTMALEVLREQGQGVRKSTFLEVWAAAVAAEAAFPQRGLRKAGSG